MNRRLPRGTDCTGTGNIISDIHTEIHPAQYQIRRRILHQQIHRQNDAVRWGAITGIAFITMLLNMQITSQRQRPAITRTVIVRRNDPDLIGQLMRQLFKHNKTFGIDAVIIGDQDAANATFGKPMLTCFRF